MQQIYYIHNAVFNYSSLTENSQTCNSIMPPKDLAPFSYISPQKNPLSTIKYELTIEFLSANG